MGVTRRTKRSFPFFRQELLVTIENLPSEKSLNEIAQNIAVFFNPEIQNIFEIDTKHSLKNLRGRPTDLNGAEIEREILFRIQGQATSDFNQEKVYFEATVETKFKEFLDGAIFYKLFTNFPEGIEVSNFSELVNSKNILITSLEIGLDYFENREFAFLGMKLQELRERIYLNLTAEPSLSGSKLGGVIESKNLQISNGFSSKIRDKIGFLAQITGIQELQAKIND